MVTERAGAGSIQQEQRRVVTFNGVPRLILDATTTADDRTLSQNVGFDAAAIIAAAGQPAISLTAAAPLWHAFVGDVTSKMPPARFQPPKGIVTASIDALSGGRPGPWTRARTTELFIAGTQPGANHAGDGLPPPVPPAPTTPP